MLQRHLSGKEDWKKRGLQQSKTYPGNWGVSYFKWNSGVWASLPMYITVVAYHLLLLFWDWDPAVQFFSNKEREDCQCLVNIQIIKTQQKETNYLNVHCNFKSYINWIVSLRCGGIFNFRKAEVTNDGTKKHFTICYIFLK